MKRVLIKRLIRLISIALTVCLLSTFILAPVANARSLKSRPQAQSVLSGQISDEFDTQLTDLVVSSMLGESVGEALKQETQPKNILIAQAQPEQAGAGIKQAVTSVDQSVYSEQSQHSFAVQTQSVENNVNSSRLRVNVDLQALLDANENPIDTDEDGLPDAVENVLGTNPEKADSDFDELTDLYEVQNGLDPMNPDSNEDGLSDYVEIVDNGQFYPDKDSDNDGDPDVWDDDNDGDGVPDRLDLSPFTCAGVNDSYRFSTLTNNEAAYLDFQVQPDPIAYLDLNGQTWDWPQDEKGLMLDSDNSSDDLKLVPMLELKRIQTGVDQELPVQEDVEDYGIVIKDENTAYIPLNPVYDAGKKVAFNGRMYFPATGGASSMNFDTKLVWVVEGKRDGVCDPATSELRDVLNFSFETAGAGIEIDDLDGNGKPDMLLMVIDNPDKDNTFRYMIGWDLDVTGTPRIYSEFYNVGNIGWEHQGGGVALYDLNNDGKKEVIMMGIDNPDGANRFRYRVGGNIDENGKFQDWSGLHESDKLQGNTLGGGVAVRDLNGNGKPDLILMAVNDLDGANSLTFMIGWDLDADGKVTGGYSQNTTGGILGDRTEGAGLAVTDLDGNGIPEYLIDTVDDPDGGNRHNYLIGWNVDGQGVPGSISQRYIANGTLLATCAGGGVAVYDINNNGIPDMALLVVGQVNNSANKIHVDWGMDLAAGNQNIIASWGAGMDIPTFLEQDNQAGGADGAGATAGDLDGNGKPEIVLTALKRGNYYSNDCIQYTIGWNMNAEGNVNGWSPLKQYDLGYQASSGDYASGARLYDIDGDAQLDLILMGISEYEPQYGYLQHIDGYNSSMWYRIGWNIDTYGNVTGGWSPIINAPSDFTNNDSSGGAGVTIGDINGNGIPDVVLMRVIDDNNSFSITYRIGWDLDSAGNAENWGDAANLEIQQEIGGIPDIDNSRGGDVLLADLNGNGNLDLVAMAVIYTNYPDELFSFRYRVGWDLADDGTVQNGWSGLFDMPVAANGYYGGGLAMGDINGNGNEELLFTTLSYWGQNFLLQYKIAWDTGSASDMVLAKYTTPCRLTGFKMEENYQADAAIFYSADKEKTTAAYVDLRYDFLDSDHPLLDANNYLQEQDVQVSNKTGSYQHADAALRAINRDFLPGALDELPNGQKLPVVIATEEKYADINMDEYGEQVGASELSGSTFRLNTKNDVAPCTVKSIKMVWFDTDNDVMVEPEGLGEIAGDYNYNDQETNELLKLLLVWDTGEARLTGIGSQGLTGEINEDEKLAAMGNFRTGMTGLKGLMLMKAYGNGMGFAISSIHNAGYTGNSIIPAIKSMGKYVRIIKGARVAPGSIAKVESILGKPLNKTQIGKFTATSRFATALRIGGAMVGTGMALYSFIEISSAGGWSSGAVALGAAYASVTMLYILMLELISELPGGVLLSALIILSDFITQWITGEGWSQRAMSWLFDVEEHQPASVMNLDLLENKVTIDDENDNGMDVGDTLTIYNKFKQTLDRSSHGEDVWIADDYIKPSLYFSGSDNYSEYHSVEKKTDIYDYSSYRVNYYNVNATLEWTKAGINIPVKVNFRADFHVTMYNGSQIVEVDDHNQSVTTLYYDVMPSSLADFLVWDAITRNDTDGDGLLNPDGAQERDRDGNIVNTNPYGWDSDNDRLSDSFELDNGTDPWSDESDRDYLPDRREYLLETDPTNWDSDGDGLSDGGELSERTISINFCGKNISVTVTSDPLHYDSDDDGLDDMQESNLGLNPSSRDTDGDGRSDASDSQPLVYNPSARIKSTVPTTLTESATTAGSLDPNTVVITIADGSLAADIARADVSAANLPAGLDYTVTRDSDTRITITITGNATNHADANDVNNLTFTIAQAKATGAEGALTTENISINFNDPPPPPTNPVVDDDNNTYGWTNEPGFDNVTDYEYSVDSGITWHDCAANPQQVGDHAYDAGAVQVRIKADSATGRPAGEALVSEQLYTIIAPTVTSVTVPAGGTYGAGQDLDFTVNFSEDVTVNTGGGTPYIPIILDTGGTVNASYVNGAVSSALLFRYTTEPGDSDNNGIAVGTAIITNGGTLQDSAGNDATLTLNSVGSTAGVLVETTVPTVTSVTVPANGTYVAGQSLDFTVNFSEAVTVNTSGGTPCLQLTVGATPRNANYYSGSGSSSIVFRYAIEPGDTGTLTVGTLEASGGALKDAAGNDANLTLNNVGDTSNILVGKNMALTAPNGGESWAAGSYQTIRWNYTGNPGQVVKIELLRSNVLNQVVSYGANTGSDGSGSHQWQVPANQATGSDYKIRVTSILDNTYTVTSEGAFTITVPQASSITLSAPNGGENWAVGGSQTISWNHTGDLGDLVKIELLKSDALYKVITTNTYIGLNGSGSYRWTVPQGLAAGNDYKIRVTVNLNNTYTDTSDGAFTITGPQAPAITVSSPGGGETWEAGSSRTIIWNYSGNIGQTVKAELLKDDALDQVITYRAFIGSSGSGSYQWTIPPGLAAGDDYKIRVTCNTYTDTSDGAFTVTVPQAPAITVSSPGGGETWAAGSSRTIRWNYTGNPGYLVKIELLKNDAVSRVITYGALIGSGGSGTYQWTIPQGLAAGDDYKIRVTSVSNNTCTDTGDGMFSITGP